MDLGPLGVIGDITVCVGRGIVHAIARDHNRYLVPSGGLLATTRAVLKGKGASGRFRRESHAQGRPSWLQ